MSQQTLSLPFILSVFPLSLSHSVFSFSLSKTVLNAKTIGNGYKFQRKPIGGMKFTGDKKNWPKSSWSANFISVYTASHMGTAHRLFRIFFTLMFCIIQGDTPHLHDDNDNIAYGELNVYECMNTQMIMNLAYITI